MTQSPDLKFQALADALQKAWAAEVPNIPDILRCQERITEHLARCAWEFTQADGDEPADRLSFDVIRNDAPEASAPRGICSPVKTDEILQFEASVRAVFGDIESCTTIWGYW